VFTSPQKDDAIIMSDYEEDLGSARIVKSESASDRGGTPVFATPNKIQ
jgi:hypothetical protein